jgi:hypothetical protein
MTNRIDWKEMTIAAVGLLALVFNPASESGKAILTRFLTPVQEMVEQASTRSQEALAEAQMRINVQRAALVENQACVRAARAQAAVEARQARIAAREACAQLRVHRAELRQTRNMRLVIVKSSDAPRLSF